MDAPELHTSLTLSLRSLHFSPTLQLVGADAAMARWAELATAAFPALRSFSGPTECRYASTATRHPFCAPLLATAAAVALSLEQLML